MEGCTGDKFCEAATSVAGDVLVRLANDIEALVKPVGGEEGNVGNVALGITEQVIYLRSGVEPVSVAEKVANLLPELRQNERKSPEVTRR